MRYIASGKIKFKNISIYTSNKFLTKHVQSLFYFIFYLILSYSFHLFSHIEKPSINYLHQPTQMELVKFKCMNFQILFSYKRNFEFKNVILFFYFKIIQLTIQLHYIYRTI